MIKSVESLDNKIQLNSLTYDYNCLFEHSKVGIVHIDINKNFIKVNNKFCKMLGFSKDELLKLTFVDITYKDDIKKDLRIHNKTREEGSKSFTLEKRYVKKNGKLVWVEVFVNHVRDEDNNFLYSLAIVTDITKRKRIQDTILEQTKTMQLDRKSVV